MPRATCCCANMSIEIEGKPLVNAACHCNNCKKRTGSAFGISVYIKDNQIVNKQGETRTYPIDDNGVTQQRFFCANCGTTLYWKISNFPDLTGIAGGCFADDNILEPEYSFSNESQCGWISLPANWKTTISKESFQ